MDRQANRLFFGSSLKDEGRGRWLFVCSPENWITASQTAVFKPAGLLPENLAFCFNAKSCIISSIELDATRTPPHCKLLSGPNIANGPLVPSNHCSSASTIRTVRKQVQRYFGISCLRDLT